MGGFKIEIEGVPVDEGGAVWSVGYLSIFTKFKNINYWMETDLWNFTLIDFIEDIFGR